MKTVNDFVLVFTVAISGAVLMACYVDSILGMRGHQWSLVPHLNFFTLLIATFILLFYVSAFSPFTDPSKGFTGFFSGSWKFSDFHSDFYGEVTTLFDGSNPVLAVSAVMLCFVSLVWPPSCLSRWVWVLVWLTLAVVLSPFRIEELKELIAHISSNATGAAPMQQRDELR